MANLKYGSTGDDVKKLQEQLGITADGIYGAQTEAAVKKYQQENGLSVDGIAGSQTLGSLNSSGNTSSGNTYSGSGKQAQADANYDPTYEGNGPGVYGNYSDYGKYSGAYDAAGGVRSDIEDDIGSAGQIVKSSSTTFPEYKSAYTDQIDQILAGILGYGKFDATNNDLYNTMYANAEKQYTANAKKAMQDAMANAAALNGGYGSSYVQSAGQQAYNDYMSGLNDVSNQLLQLAYSQWQDELSSKYDQLSALRGLDSDAYTKWQQNYSNQVAADQYQTQLENSYLSDALQMAEAGLVPTVYSDYLDDDTMTKLTDIANQVKAENVSSKSSSGKGTSGTEEKDTTESYKKYEQTFSNHFTKKKVTSDGLTNYNAAVNISNALKNGVINSDQADEIAEKYGVDFEKASDYENRMVSNSTL